MTSISSTTETDTSFYRCPGATCLHSDDLTPRSDAMTTPSTVDPKEPSGEGPIPRDSRELQQLNAAPERELPTSKNNPSNSVGTPSSLS